MFVEWIYNNGYISRKIVDTPENINRVEFEGTKELCEQYIQDLEEQFEFDCYEALSSY